jgi:transketolase
MPNLTLWRPADAVETAVAWCAAIEHDSGPTALALSRQGLPQLTRDAAALDGIRRGGYILLDCQGKPECIVIATGSEVGLALQAVKGAQGAGRRVRLVSMPCTELFDAQEPAWREAVLPAAVTARVTVEAGSTALWWRYAGSGGRVIGVDHFGASGKGPAVFEKFGITAQHVRQAIDELTAAR